MIRHISGLIYFLQASENGPVKIGIVKDKSRLNSRINTLQVGHYKELILIRCIPGTLMTEKWLHYRYIQNQKHIRGEWFEFDSDMLTIIPPSYEEIIKIKFPVLKVDIPNKPKNLQSKWQQDNELFNKLKDMLESNLKATGIRGP